MRSQKSRKSEGRADTSQSLPLSEKLKQILRCAQNDSVGGTVRMKA